ncbi:MAG TPA: methylated-DNA--[protein]-cysteine S-methyltransferase [Candidatus Udaeobacter sp.]|jgi:methylated-DNA-[protein]-cysteine S-methyltransferase|nr:methylated-DNA--[protein]-cysteine S-methyltransferase [Candidatus Udaeobacter sp.]
MNLERARVTTPIGHLTLFFAGGTVCSGGFTDREPAMLNELKRRFGAFTVADRREPHPAVAALERYAAGDVGALDAIEVEAGGTAFQRRVWSALRRIPAGRTTSYAAIAKEIGSPRAVRAVGAANGANPVAIVVPCHRVIGSSGALQGYAGGLERKRALLEHEARHAPALIGG